MPLRLSADVGGTFTDVVRLDEASGGYAVTKVPTVPDDIALGMVRGFDEIVGGDYRDVATIVYGTTAGLNALIQRSGPRCALLTTAGFRDVYEIGRANHPRMYDNHYRKPTPLVRRSDVVEITGRLSATGAVVTDLDEEQVLTWAREHGPDYASVAVAYVHAYANEAHERTTAALLRSVLGDDVPISLSSATAPELGEYERTASTVLNAYMAPIIRGYVRRVRALLAERGFTGQVLVMQSNGGVLTERVASEQAVRTAMSGPVGGTIGAGVVGARHGADRVLAVDMGGTSFDVSLVVDARPEVALESTLEGFPVLVPSVQTLSIGAGGGSVAWTQAGGMRVGPRSSGARPGPACYGHGGTEPTTTDANVVAGMLDPAAFLGGRMALDAAAAHRVVAAYGSEHGLPPRQAAQGILTIVNTAMADAIGQITLQRGLDAREFTMVAYGGAGPLHAVALAEELDLDRVIVPPDPGTFSAWGMLHADLRHDAVVSVNRVLAGLTAEQIADFLASARSRIDPEMAELIARVPGEAVVLHSLDLRYEGQKYTVNLSLEDAGDVEDAEHATDRIRAAFDDRYRVLYGFSSPNTAVEVVNARVALIAPPQARPRAAHTVASDPAAAAGEIQLAGALPPAAALAPSRSRASIVPGAAVAGPVVLTELTSTTAVPAGWLAHAAADGSLLLTRTSVTPPPGEPADPHTTLTPETTADREAQEGHR